MVWNMKVSHTHTHTHKNVQYNLSKTGSIWNENLRIKEIILDPFNTVELKSPVPETENIFW